MISHGHDDHLEVIYKELFKKSQIFKNKGKDYFI